MWCVHKMNKYILYFYGKNINTFLILLISVADDIPVHRLRLGSWVGEDGHTTTSTSTEDGEQLALDIIEGRVDESTALEEERLGSFLGVLREGVAIAQPEDGPPVRGPMGVHLVLGGSPRVTSHNEAAHEVGILPRLFDLAGDGAHSLFIDYPIGGRLVELEGHPDREAIVSLNLHVSYLPEFAL